MRHDLLLRSGLVFVRPLRVVVTITAGCTPKDASTRTGDTAETGETAETADTGESVTSWSFADELSDVANPNGVYAHGWMPTLGGTFTPMSTAARGAKGCGKSIVDWFDPALGGLPAVAKNMGATHCSTIPPGWLNLHPGPSDEYAVIRWTSPVAGDVLIEGVFSAGDVAQLSYYVRVDGATRYSAILTPDDGVFSLAETVAVGTVVEFAVGEGFSYGSTPFAATITRR